MLYGTELAETEEIFDLWMLAFLQVGCSAAHISFGLMIPPGFHGTNMVAGKIRRLQLETFGHFFLSIQLSESAHSMRPTISLQSPLHYSQVIKAAPLRSMNRTLNGGISSNPGLGPRTDRRKEG